MTGRTISQLDGLPQPLTGAEYIPIVQNGVTYKVPVRTLLSAGFTGSDLSSIPVTITTTGQTAFTLPDDVDQVEQVQVNGQGVSPSAYTFAAPTLTFTGLGFDLETTDELLVQYSTEPTATQS